MNKYKRQQGFTFIEILTYAAVLTTVSIVVVLFIFNFIKIQARTRVSKEMTENTQRAMEIMIEKIRRAENIYQSSSHFDSHPGQLSILTNNNTPEGEEKTYIDFFLDEAGRFCIKEEGKDVEKITSNNVKINNLIFQYLPTENIESIRIEISAIASTSNKNAKQLATTTLISTAIIRP